VLQLQYKHLAVRPFHFLYFITLLFYYSLRDELSGKGYYGLLVERAIMDFLAGRQGKGERLPTLSLTPAEPVLAGILASDSSVMVLEPTRRAVFTQEQFAAGSQTKKRITGVCNKQDMRFTALPADAPRIRLSSRQLVMAAQLLKLAIFKRRADYLILDVDQPCGLLGLCARQILILVDDQCLTVPGGFIRILKACQWPFRWLRAVGNYVWSHNGL
jgi:hypothetical protein